MKQASVSSPKGARGGSTQCCPVAYCNITACGAWNADGTVALIYRRDWLPAWIKT
jgi:hypothetical protein